MKNLLNIYGLIFFMLILGITSNVFCQKKHVASEQLGHGYEFKRNGKDNDSPKQEEVYQLWSIPFSFEEVLKSGVRESIQALEIQEEYLSSKSRTHKYGNLSFNDAKLSMTVDILLKMTRNKKNSTGIKLYRIAGEDTLGNVHFTAYYTPVLEARRQKDDVFVFQFRY